MAHRRPVARPADAASFHVLGGMKGGSWAMVRKYCSTRFGEPLDEELRGPTTSGDEKQRLSAKRLADLLRESPALANTNDTDAHRAGGASPVHVAVQHGNVHALAALIAAGADLNLSKNNGATALHTAIFAYGQGSKMNPSVGPAISAEEWERRCLQCFEMLIVATADLHRCHSSRGGDGFDLVVACTAHEHSRPDACLPFLKRLLARGCRVDSLHSINQSDGCGETIRIRDATAALWAVKHGHTRCLELLLLAGADPTVVGTFPDGRASAYDCALEEATDDDGGGEGDDAALETFGMVAAVLKGNTTALIRGGESLDPRLILRCKEELRHRRRLGERRRNGAVSAAHREHAARGLRMARELLEANEPHAGRLCYLDALLFVEVGGGAGGGGRGEGGAAGGSASPILILEAPSLSLSFFGNLRNEAFEALYNVVHCEQVLAAQQQTREAHFLCRQAAEELVAAFPSRAMAWVAYGKTLYDMEQGLARSEGFDTKAAAHGRQSTEAAVRRCVERARLAPDSTEHVQAIDDLARAADMSICPVEARSYELYCQAVRRMDDDDTPSGRALQVDLISQSLALKERGAARRQRGAIRFEVANSLQCKLAGHDDLRELASCRVVEGSALRVVELLAPLSALMPAHACAWVVAAAKVSRAWRAAAIMCLQEAGLRDLQPDRDLQPALAQHGAAGVADGVGPRGAAGGGAARDATEGEALQTEEALQARFNLANALAMSGRLAEARAAAVEVWTARLASDAEDRRGRGHRSGGGCFSHAPQGQATWSAWADMTANALTSGARLVGLMAHGGEPPPLVVATERGLRDDLAAALLVHAERLREHGATPAALLSTVLSAQSVVGDRFTVPPLLERAIRGWAGSRGAELSGTELDTLWGQMLHDARASRRRGGTRGTPRAEDAAAIAASFLDGMLLPPAERETQRGAARSSRKGKASGGKGKASKKGKGKATGGGRRPRKEEEEEGEEEEEEEEREEAETPAAEVGDEGGGGDVVPAVNDLAEQMGSLSAREQLPDYDAECPICQETAEEVGSAFLTLPCGGRHGICRPCAYAWQATCVRSAAEFSCPMCRESLEGWEPA